MEKKVNVEKTTKVAKSAKSAGAKSAKKVESAKIVWLDKSNKKVDYLSTLKIAADKLSNFEKGLFIKSCNNDKQIKEAIKANKPAEIVNLLVEKAQNWVNRAKSVTDFAELKKEADTTAAKNAKEAFTLHKAQQIGTRSFKTYGTPIIKSFFFDKNDIEKELIYQAKRSQEYDAKGLLHYVGFFGAKNIKTNFIEIYKICFDPKTTDLSAKVVDYTADNYTQSNAMPLRKENILNVIAKNAEVVDVPFIEVK